MNKLSRGALLLAMAVVLQAIRLILPLPLQVSTFLIGSLVHMMLVITTYSVGRKPALLMGWLLPIFAYLQGQLALSLLIPVVILGNFLFVQLLPRGGVSLISLRGLLVPPLMKGLFMGGSTFFLLKLVELQIPAMEKLLLFGMSVPQLVTGIIGILLANYILTHYKIGQ